MEISNNIAEVVLLGTGGYGESVLVHRGDKKWLVVDSCINPNTGISLPYEYLLQRGVDVVNDVDFVVCTHWHDDHIRGISKILEEAKSAQFVFTNATDKLKFLRLVALDHIKISDKVSNSSTEEFSKCLDIQVKRSRTPIFASIDRLVNTFTTGAGTLSSVYALSPSDRTMQNFNLEISTLLDDLDKKNRKIPSRDPNSKSIVLFLQMGYHCVILGGDLEVVELSPEEGWLNILNASQVVKGRKSSLIKVSHHGSENGFHERIWSELLVENPVAKTSTYNKNYGLPTIGMVGKYSSLTDKFYLTAPHHDSRMKRRDRSIERLLKFMSDRLAEIRYDFGVIRCSIDMTNPSANWVVETSGNAFHVNVRS